MQNWKAENIRRCGAEPKVAYLRAMQEMGILPPASSVPYLGVSDSGLPMSLIFRMAAHAGGKAFQTLVGVEQLCFITSEL